MIVLDNKLWPSVWTADPRPAVVDSLGLVTIGVLALTERFEAMPAATVAFAAAHVIASLGDDA
jgi:hypothetical protein